MGITTCLLPEKNGLFPGGKPVPELIRLSVKTAEILLAVAPGGLPVVTGGGLGARGEKGGEKRDQGSSFTLLEKNNAQVKRKETNSTDLRDAQNWPFVNKRQIVLKTGTRYSGFLKCAQCFVSALARFAKLLSFLNERSKIYL
jgi:hypothetical protein